MKVSRLFPMVLAGFSSVAFAQAQGIRIGITGGANLAHVDGDVSDISNRTAGLFGAYVAFPLSSSGWSFQTGAAYTAKGWKRDEPVTHDLAIAKLNYIEVPALLRYDFAAPASAGLFAYGGPAVSFRTSCSLDATTHSTGATQSATCAEVESASNGSVGFNSIDWGLLGGLGLRVPVGRVSLIGTAQYEHGLRSVQTSRDVKNRAFSFGLGVELPLHLP